MPFIPHTDNDIQTMLDAIGANDVETLFDEIPAALRATTPDTVPAGLNEQAITRLMHERAARDGMALSFLGGGAYEHHIPAAVWQIVTRGEFYSAYTPYQAEASQGTLQVIYEYQTMMARLMAMDVANASLYDGASAVAEACLMAVRATRKAQRRILVAGTLHPHYRECIDTIAGLQNIEFVDVAFDAHTGRIDPATLDHDAAFDALVIAQPNFLGVLEDVHALTDWAHAHKALVIGVVNPIAMALLAPPGDWGERGADIVCGEGQPLGVPLASGGPYFGFMCSRKKLMRAMPGRLVGRTTDLDGREGFTLTLQAREQHIRRSKATSNICTNQGLLVTAATIYMAMLGAEGLKRVAATAHARTRQLADALTAINGVNRTYSGAFFHEIVLTLERPAREVLATLAEQDILGGLALSDWYPHAENQLLVCATETKTEDDITRYATALAQALAHTEAA